MKFIIGALLSGGTLVAAELPAVDYDECAIVTTDIETGVETFIDPDPDATALRFVVYCGQRAVTPTGGIRNERSLKVIDVDREQAEIIIQAADDMLTADS